MLPAPAPLVPVEAKLPEFHQDLRQGPRACEFKPNPLSDDNGLLEQLGCFRLQLLQEVNGALWICCFLFTHYVLSFLGRPPV
jgi:hypothetical protein